MSVRPLLYLTSVLIWLQLIWSCSKDNTIMRKNSRLAHACLFPLPWVGVAHPLPTSSCLLFALLIRQEDNKLKDYWKIRILVYLRWPPGQGGGEPVKVYLSYRNTPVSRQMPILKRRDTSLKTCIKVRCVVPPLRWWCVGGSWGRRLLWYQGQQDTAVEETPPCHSRVTG